jgi:hypothetical protein
MKLIYIFGGVLAIAATGAAAIVERKENAALRRGVGGSFHAIFAS